MKISVALDNRDWGRVVSAIEHTLGFERRIASEAPSMHVEMRIANLARIRASLKNQRKSTVLKEATR